MQKKKQFRFVFTLPDAPFISSHIRSSFLYFLLFAMPPFGHMTLPHKGAMIELRKSGVRAISIAKRFGYSRGTKTNRTQSLEGCFLRLPQKALRVYAKAHAGGH